MGTMAWSSHIPVFWQQRPQHSAYQHAALASQKKYGGMQLKILSTCVVQGHRARVGTMAWSSHILSSGSRDRNILQRDVRAPEDYIHKLVGHRSEVCTPTCTLQQLRSVSLSGCSNCQKLVHHCCPFCFDASCKCLFKARHMNVK